MNTAMEHNMITVQLTVEQARLASAALNAELRHLGTLIDEPEALAIREVIAQIAGRLSTVEAALMSRIERAVEDYCDACDYASYKQLTDEDTDYLAGELQIGVKEFRELIGLI